MQTLNKINYAPLYESIGHVFNDISLLEQALTHRSAGKRHNERLEFLGDAVLGMCIADSLYEKFPEQPEGTLTRMRSNLVKGATLADIARELNIGGLLKLGSGEMKSGGHRRDSILADCVEALLGAIYLESGIDAVRGVIAKLYKERIEQLDPNVQIKDSKTQLQEYLQSRRLELPAYNVVKVTGKDHAQTFTVSCDVHELQLNAQAIGKSRRIAEQKAAHLIIEKLSTEKHPK
ncbi:ribonuclease III [Ningiella sp. W23]|uniref:ribonuclease III n=1 Tax=Ningiella sp. W23 TaxID=3023715 RepID=UPI00375661E0